MNTTTKKYEFKLTIEKEYSDEALVNLVKQFKEKHSEYSDIEDVDLFNFLYELSRFRKEYPYIVIFNDHELNHKLIQQKTKRTRDRIINELLK